MTEFLQIIGALGIGAIASNYFSMIWGKKQEDKKRHQEYKETRYKCLTMLMHAHLNFEQNVDLLQENGYGGITRAGLQDLLKAELMNSYIFASNKFIESFEKFLDAPNEESRLNVVKAIRKDLWSLR